MTGRAAPSIIATAVAAGCGGPGPSAGPPPVGILTYGIPAPPSAVYHIGDTLSAEMDSPMGGLQVTGSASVTIGLAFGADPAGVRAVGTVEAFAASVTNPMMGTETAGLDELNGNLEVVVGRHGVEELVSFPELSGPAAMMSSFPGLGHLLFPRLPGGDVDPGSGWVDTVISSTGTEGGSATVTAISTYTLVGDTVVDGSNLVHIAATTELTTEDTFEEGGMSMTRKMAGSAEGLILWHPERGLVAYTEFERDMKGTVSMGAMGEMGVTVTGPTRIRLQGW